MIERDPKLYRRLSKPFKTPADAESAVSAFFTRVAKLRKSLKMPNVVLIVEAEYEDGEVEKTVAAHYLMGDSLRHEMMLAYSLGQSRAKREDVMKALMGCPLDETKEQSA